MKQLNRFQFAKHDGPYEKWPMYIELLQDGISTGKKIPGYVIEAQYEHPHGFLLVTSWDCLFEETPTFLLLSHEFDIIVEKTIGAPYASVWIDGHESVDENTIIFRCKNDLEILATIESPTTLRLKRRHCSRENNVTNNDNPTNTKGD